MDQSYLPLNNFGIIGNMETCALIGTNGSIDWCCLPHLESPSVFARILDSRKGGHFYIRPAGNFESYQQYIENTNVLQTIFTSGETRVILTDFMPVAESESREKYRNPAIFRTLDCQDEPVKMIA
ncbi:MAG TPA: trehalase-like domain-containing protein [bacterium]|nr:trehalase-like domain-containing protein [bacterium]